MAQLNEHTNPERARRILEKVHRLEERWEASKGGRDHVRATHVVRNERARAQAARSACWKSGSPSTGRPRVAATTGDVHAPFLNDATKVAHIFVS